MSISHESPIDLFPDSELLVTDQSAMPKNVNVGPMFQPPEGFPFDSNSPIRRFADPAMFALYGYIAGLTVMNDKVAAAVDKHSGFREQPWNRLFGTATAAMTLIFGNEAESLAMAERLWHFHETVSGTNKNVNYSANDANLQTWVLACVFKGIEETNRRWAKPLRDEREGLYQDVKTFGKVFGIQESLLPENVDALDSYWETMLDGDSLLQTDVSLNMAHAVFRFHGPQIPEYLAHIGQIISIVSLDPRLRDKANLHLTKLEERIAQTFDFTAKNTYGRSPRILREQAIPVLLALRRRFAPTLGKLVAAD